MPTRKPTGAETFSFDAPRPPRATIPSRPARVRPRRRSQEEVRREKRAKFKQVIVPRVNKAIHDISLLVHGSNRKRYHSTKDDHELIRQALLDAVEKALAPYVEIEKPESIEFKD
jgi:hypothetical protein